MKIAFYVYPTAFQSPGGGEVLLLKTKEYLEKAGVSVKLLDPWHDKLRDFDLLHTFGSVKDALPMMEAARRAGIKNVLSTVCWYNWKSAWGTYPDFKTRLLSLARHGAKCWFPGLPSQRKRMMEISDLLLPNSESEAGQLTRFFNVPKEKIRVIPNAVDESFANISPDLFTAKYGFRDFILLVGRIEPRKNQLNVIRALKGIPNPVVVIGDVVPGYESYEAACRRAADENVHFLGGLPHGSAELKSAYAACNTFVLGTWLETPGLAALEAGLAGAKVVITREGATREYFQDLAAYVSPENPAQIRAQVLKALQKPKTPELSKRIKSEYLWQGAAKRTANAYKEVLGCG